MQPVFRNIKARLPNTDKAYKDMVSIPMHSGLTIRDAEEVVNAIKDFYKRA